MSETDFGTKRHQGQKLTTGQNATKARNRLGDKMSLRSETDFGIKCHLGQKQSERQNVTSVRDRRRDKTPPR